METDKEYLRVPIVGELKEDDIVMITSEGGDIFDFNSSLKTGDVAKVLGKSISVDYTSLEFDRHIGGHTGLRRDGKDGHCYNFRFSMIKESCVQLLKAAIPPIKKVEEKKPPIKRVNKQEFLTQLKDIDI